MRLCENFSQKSVKICQKTAKNPNFNAISAAEKIQLQLNRKIAKQRILIKTNNSSCFPINNVSKFKIVEQKKMKIFIRIDGEWHHCAVPIDQY